MSKKSLEGLEGLDTFFITFIYTFLPFLIGTLCKNYPNCLSY